MNHQVATHPHGHGHGHGHEHAHASWPGRLLALFRPHSHDHADSIDSALSASAEGIRAVKISLVVLGATALAQVAVVLATGSVALLADTVHNFSDALTAVPLWIAFALSRRPPSPRYTYGLGRAEDLAGIFIVAMIGLSALVAGWESVRRLIDPVELTYPGAVIAAGVIGFLGNEAVAAYRINVGRRIGSAALVADGLHARTDGMTSLAVAVGAGGVLLGAPLADPVVGLLITVMIVVVLRGAARDVYRRLMDGVDPEVTTTAHTTLVSLEGVRTVDSLRVRWSGHSLHLEAEIGLDQHLSLTQAHELVQHARLDLAHQVDRLASGDAHITIRPITPDGAVLPPSAGGSDAPAGTPGTRVATSP